MAARAPAFAPPANPRFFGRLMSVIDVRDSASMVGELSVEPLSTTTMESAIAFPAPIACTHRRVSDALFQLTMTAATCLDKLIHLLPDQLVRCAWHLVPQAEHNRRHESVAGECYSNGDRGAGHPVAGYENRGHDHSDDRGTGRNRGGNRLPTLIHQPGAEQFTGDDRERPRGENEPEHQGGGI